MYQNHLNNKNTVNLGSYYTPREYIDKCYQYLKDEIENIDDFCIMDTSCGYGNFLNQGHVNSQKIIGSDIDSYAISVARRSNLNIKYFRFNALFNVNRSNYGLNESDKLIIIGNPPYNDITSLVSKDIKTNRKILNVDEDIKVRDLGMSFLLSYNKLDAYYVCVLHPLSYLIKRANFSLLKKFFNNYRLINSLVFNSQEFNDTSKITGFPIVIAFYKKSKRGMDYDFVKKYEFRTAEGNTFSINRYDYIDNYISKYPNKKKLNHDEIIAYFWTMRDINALKRSRTFVEKQSYNTINVTKKNIHYYCYVDVFKKFINNMPYYFGNSNIMIDLKRYDKIKEDITKYSIITNSVLRKKYKMFNFNMSKQKIQSYFENLLEEHYVY